MSEESWNGTFIILKRKKRKKVQLVAGAVWKNQHSLHPQVDADDQLALQTKATCYKYFTFRCLSISFSFFLYIKKITSVVVSAFWKEGRKEGRRWEMEARWFASGQQCFN